MSRPTKEESAAKSEERKPKYTMADFAASDRLAKDLKARREGKQPSKPRTVPLKPGRLAKLQEEDRNLHALLQHDSVKKVTRELHAQHGVSSPAMRAQSSRPSSGPPPIYEGYNSRMPTKHKGKVFFGGKPGKELPMTKASSSAPPKATPKPSAPAPKMVDQVADSQARKTARTAAKPKSSGMSSVVAKATARARAKAAQEPSGLEHNEATVQPSRHGAKAPMTDHLQPQQFPSQSHRASSTATKPAKQSYVGKHRGSYNEAHDYSRVALSGSISYGKHSAEGMAMYNKVRPSDSGNSRIPLSAEPANIGDKVRARMSRYAKAA